jgi:integrase
MGIGTRAKSFRGVTTRKLKHGETIYISFMYRGDQCREPLSGLNADLVGDWEYASGIKLEIERKIQQDTFVYSEYFPNSLKLKKFGKGGKKELTVLHYIKEYIEHCKTRGLSPSTIEGYNKAKNGLSQIHSIAVTQLEPADLKKMIKESGVSLKTMRNRMSVLNSALNEAVVERVIQVNPCASIKPHQYLEKAKKINTMGEHEDVDPFTPDEITAVLNACRYDQAKNLLQFAFYSGLRSSELAGLKWRDVDLFKGELRVREAVLRNTKDQVSITKAPKTSAGARKMELLPKAISSLKAQKEFTFLQNEYVFHEPKQNKPITGADQIRKNIWHPAIKLSGVRYRNPYQTRHTFATMQISKGENLWWIADQMGHDGPEMLFRHYGNYLKEHDQKAGRGFSSNTGS